MSSNCRIKSASPRWKTATLGRRSLAVGLVSGSLLLLLLGCASDGVSRGGSSGITQLHLFSAPVAVTLGTAPTANGIALKIFACEGDDSKGVSITTGQLEILLFDGLLQGTNADNMSPLKVWSLAPKDLRRFEFKRAMGVFYDLALGWEPTKPKAGRITVVARYRSSKNQVVSSDSVVISTTAR